MKKPQISPSPAASCFPHPEHQEQQWFLSLLYINWMLGVE